MQIVNIKNKKVVFILECKERLTPGRLQKIATDENLKNHSIEETKVFTSTREAEFKYFNYKLSY